MSITHPARAGETLAQVSRNYVRYHDSLEVPEDGEQQVFDEIIKVMRSEAHITEERYGHAVRSSHAKSHGLARGELKVIAGLPPELAQGLFAEAKTYPVIVRLAHVPGEILDDRKVSTPRGMALKILGVAGPMLPSHEGEATQDFLLDTGTVFPSPGPRSFLATIKTLKAATPAPEGLKQVMSATSRVSNAALSAVGMNSPNLDFFGHPLRDPLAESYYSQTPYRYGDYVAKLRISPITPALRRLADGKLDMCDDENGLRTAVTRFMRSNSAEFEVAVQLCTDLDEMPVENAHTEWPEEESPYRAVARIVLPPQDAYSPARRDYVEETLSFDPAHCLAAHRPLGGINRARLQAYRILAGMRRARNCAAINEPRSIDELPD